MRAIAARVGARLVDRTVFAIEENAPRIPAAENRLVVFKCRGGCVLVDEAAERNPQMLCEALGIALRDISLRYLATVRAGAAVDLILDILRHAAKTQLWKIMAFEVAAEDFVLTMLLLPEPLDLDKIGDHLHSE